MNTAQRSTTTAVIILLLASIVCAQEQNSATSSRSAITVTAAQVTLNVGSGGRVGIGTPSPARS